MGTRQDHAEAVTSPSSSPYCVQCGRPVVRNHRCPATPATSQLHGPPPDWREQVEAERSTASALAPSSRWEEEPLPFDDAPDP